MRYHVFNFITLSIIIGLTSCSVMFQSASSFEDDLTTKLLSIEGNYKHNDQNIYIQRIIEVNGSRDDLFIKLLEFLTRTYNDANEVIQVKDKEEGIIVCKGCHRFNVNDFLYGSAIEETAWHIFKAEVKDNKVRVTISLGNMDWYYPGSTSGGVYLSPKKGSYSLFECPPFADIDNKNDHVRKGYVFYYAVSNAIDLMQSTEDTLIKQTVYDVDNDW